MSKRTNDEMQPRGAQIFPSVEALEQLRREVLIDLWPKVMGTAVPRSMSQGLLRRFLAFELQARTSGGLSKADLAEIARLGAVSSRAKTARMGQGSRFFREWNGITHVVERTEAGYLWNGAVHASLSAIAKAITGAHWSGPRFFGVKTAPNAAASKKRAPK